MRRRRVPRAIRGSRLTNWRVDSTDTRESCVSDYESDRDARSASCCAIWCGPLCNTGATNSSGAFGYESCVRARGRRVPSAPGAARAVRWSSSKRATAYGVPGGPNVCRGITVALRGAVTAWRGGRDRISHTHLICASSTRLEVTREEPDYPYAHADARRLRPGPARVYALLVALIALVAVAAVKTSGQAVNSIFSTVASQLQSAAQAGGA